jgi:hypothetical protein
MIIRETRAEGSWLPERLLATVSEDMHAVIIGHDFSRRPAGVDHDLSQMI